MTVEELEIIVQANVEEALKEFQKLVPGIERTTKKIAKAINRFDFSGFSGKLKQATENVKKELNKLNKSNEIIIKVTTDDAKKTIDQTKKQLDSLKKQNTGRF